MTNLIKQQMFEDRIESAEIKFDVKNNIFNFILFSELAGFVRPRCTLQNFGFRHFQVQCHLCDTKSIKLIISFIKT